MHCSKIKVPIRKKSRDLLNDPPIYIYIGSFGIKVRVFVNSPRNVGSILGRVIPKTQKIVLDAPGLNTQHYKVQI